MNEIEKALWPGWETVRLIGRGSFGAVYEIQRRIFDDVEKAALKVITIPQNASDLDEMYSDGYDAESITATFQAHLKSIVSEYSLMRKMNGSANIVNCDDVRYVQHDDGIGWDIYIKMELLTPLTKALTNEVPEETVIRIAKDLCSALVLCNKHEIIHRDIKPQNIFVSPNGDYKLGDFGIAKTVEKTMGGTKIGTYKYMAPEVYNNQPYGSSADLYSLGLVLYWLLNEHRMPFLPLPPAKLMAGMDEDARQRRLSGEKIPAPAHGSDKLKAIVLKACAYAPSERYSSAMAMLDDLCNLSGGSEGVSISENVIVPQTEIEEEPKTTGPVFPNHTKKMPEEDLTETTVGPRFSSKENTTQDSSNNADTEISGTNTEEASEVPTSQNKIIHIIPLVALWIVSVILTVFVLADIPRYIPHVQSANVWVYVSIFTGWVIPTLALLSLRLTTKRKTLKTVCTVAVFLQLFFLAFNLFLTFVPVSAVEIYRFFPGAIIMEEMYWVVGSWANEWAPFIVCLLAMIVLLVKDFVAQSIITSAIKAESENSENNNAKTVKIGLVVLFAALLLVFAIAIRSCDGEQNEGTGVTEGNSSTEQWIGVDEHSLASKGTNFAYGQKYAEGFTDSYVFCALIDANGHLWLCDINNENVYDTNVEDVKDVAVVQNYEPELYYLTTDGNVWKAEVQWNSGWTYLGAEKCDEWSDISRIYGFRYDHSKLVLLDAKGNLFVDGSKVNIANVVDVQCISDTFVVRTQDGKFYGFGKNKFGTFAGDHNETISSANPAILSIDSNLTSMRVVRVLGVQELMFATLSTNGTLTVYDDKGNVATQTGISVDDIISEDCSLYIVSDDGKVYGYGALSSGHYLTSSANTKQNVSAISEFETMNGVYAIAPQTHGCLAIDNSGKCFYLGQEGYDLGTKQLNYSDGSAFIYPMSNEEFSLSQSSLKFTQVGDYTILAATSSAVIWSTNAPDVVSVDSQGRVVALNNGTAEVYAQANGETKVCKVEVVTTPPTQQIYDRAAQLISIVEEYERTHKTYSYAEVQAMYDEYIKNGNANSFAVIAETQNAKIIYDNHDWYCDFTVRYFDDTGATIYTDEFTLVIDGSFHTERPPYSRWVTSSVYKDLFSICTEKRQYHCYYSEYSDWIEIWDAEYIDGIATRSYMLG